MKYIFIVLILLPIFCNAQEGEISNKTNIIKRKLKNGFTYYLFNNPISKGKVNIYLLQKAGAILEDDDQDGLAHFLEHMCFKGSKHFPKRAIRDMFDKKGLSSSINACTQLENTQYFLKNIPTKDKIFVDKCILAAFDWCNFLNLEECEMATERPVIVEELRTRRDSRQRIAEQTTPVTHNNSIYSRRFVTGIADYIKEFKRESLVRFYKDWYRSDMQALVIVGNINVYEYEEKIRNLFSQLPKLKNSRPYPSLIIPDNKEILYTTAEDKDNSQGQIYINCRHKKEIFNNLKDRVDYKYLKNLTNFMISKRVAQLLKKDTSNFIKLSINNYMLCKHYDNYSISVFHKTNRAKEALTQAIALHKDILENGFTEIEFKDAKEYFIKNIEKFKNYKGYFKNSHYYNKIMMNFIYNSDILHSTDEYKYFKKFISKLKLEDIQSYVKNMYCDKNKNFIVIKNGKDNEYLSKQDIINIEKNTTSKKIFPKKDKKENYEKPKLIKELILDLKPGKIRKEEDIKSFKAEKWILSNGATVIFKECGLSKNLININVFSYGGNSLYSDKNFINAKAFNSFTRAYGFENFSSQQFVDIFKNTSVRYKFNLSRDYEQLNLSSQYGDVNDMFKLLHIIFEKPNFYKKEFDKIIKKINKSVEEKRYNVKSKIKDSISQITSPKNRSYIVDTNFVKNIDFETIKKIYKERYSDASNFTFYIVGCISKSRAKKLVEKYIGSIKSTYSKETFKTHKSSYSSGYSKKIIKLDMVDKKAGNVLILNHLCRITTKKQLAFSIIKGFLHDKLNKILRERENGTYGVGVRNILSTNGEESCKYEINYECDPDKIIHLNEVLNKALKGLANTGLTQKELDMFKSMLNKNNKYLKNNNYYLLTLKVLLSRGEDMSNDDFYDLKFKEIDLIYINNLLKEIVNNSGYLDILYLPE